MSRMTPVFIATIFSMVACAEVEVDPPSGPDEETATTTRGHAMPMHVAGIRQPFAVPDANLTWRGGPMLPNVKVWTVFWGANVVGRDQLPGFYTAVTQSAHFDWLSEYNTTRNTIGRGSFGGSVNDPSPPGGTAITDATVQTELTRLINAGQLPQPDANNLFMVHFAPGISITMGGDRSCQVFCAYHNTYRLGGKNVYYGVIPDMGGACAGGCGSGTQFANTTEVASHEMIEAVTDAAVGVDDLAWYDDRYGEIGDICNGQAAVVAGYTVQKEWSNKDHNCIATRAGTPPPPQQSDFTVTANPTSRTIAAGASGTFQIATAVAAGMPGTVSFTVDGLPAGVTASFQPASLQAGAASTLTVSVNVAAASANATLVVHATAGMASHTINIALTVTGQNNGGGGGGGGNITNGGFESGNLSSWTVYTGSVSVDTSAPHAGKWAARIGSTQPFNGESAIYRSIDVPLAGQTTLRFFYNLHCADTYQWDQQQAYILDRYGYVVGVIFDTCKNDGTWQQAAVSLTKWAGKRVYMYFSATDDAGAGDPTYWLLDDVTVTTQ